MAVFDNSKKNDEFDVIILGGGIAGLSIARHLKLLYKDIKIMILDMRKFPIPISTYKVGESTLEIAGYYFTEHLKLKEYLDEKHLTKMGLRYFWLNDTEIVSSPEIGPERIPEVQSFQIDRGLIENDLWFLNEEMGIQVTDHARIIDFEIKSDSMHKVVYKNLSKESIHELRSRWLIDATGRSRLLQRKLSLGKKVKSKHSAIWFRVKGKINIEDLNVKNEVAWKERVVTADRSLATVHLMGKGYWVWIIPLSSENTSIGIVTDGKEHPFKEYNTKEKALLWLIKNEPKFLSLLRGKEIFDFGVMKNYSYSSRRIFSEDRWGCVGEAALFPDPFQSPGFNLIAYESIVMAKMVKDDIDNELDSSKIKYYSDLIISESEWTMFNTQCSYSYFHNPAIFSASDIWDFIANWSISFPQFYYLTFLNNDLNQIIKEITSEYTNLNLIMKRLFIDWERQSNNNLMFSYIDKYSIPFLYEIREQILQNKSSSKEVLAELYKRNLDLIKRSAVSFFLIAIEDVMPEKLPFIMEKRSLNYKGISMDSNIWEENGLFSEIGVEYQHIWSQLRGLYKINNNNFEKEKSIEINLNI